MTILLAITLAAAIQPTCSWDNPGRNRYTGDAAAAVDHYGDIPAAVRATLKRRIDDGVPDEQVSITRDGISGKNQYDGRIRDMHFGNNSLCGTVTRGKWAADRVEPAAVYCVGEHCILVPKICGNISRVSRSAAPLAAAKAAGAAEASDERAIPDGLTQFDDIRLVDAPLRDEPLELGLLDEEQADKNRRRLAGGPQPGDIDHPDTSWGPGHVPNDNGDDSIPQPVPEPETWAMLLGGLGLVGWMARRRAARRR